MVLNEKPDRIRKLALQQNLTIINLSKGKEKKKKKASPSLKKQRYLRSHEDFAFSVL